MVIDEGFYKGMRDKLYERFQSGASVILYEMGLGYGDIMGKDMVNMGVSKFETITKFMELGKKRGYGEFHIPLLRSFLSTLKGEPVVSFKNSFFATSVGRTGKAECYIMAGIIAGASRVLLNKEFVCVEEKCLCKGDSSCEFKLKESQNTAS